MGLEDIEGLEKLESFAYDPNGGYEQCIGLYALDDFLYLKEYSHTGKIAICTNDRNNNTYWSVKKLQERISAVLKEKGIDYKQVSASNFLERGSINNKYDDGIKMQVYLRKRGKQKIFGENSIGLVKTIVACLGALVSVAMPLAMPIAATVANPEVPKGYFVEHLVLGGFLGVFAGFGTYITTKCVEPVMRLPNKIFSVNSTRLINKIKSINKEIYEHRLIVNRPDEHAANQVIYSERRITKLQKKRATVAEKLAKVYPAFKIIYEKDNKVKQFLEQILTKPEEQLSEEEISEEVAIEKGAELLTKLAESTQEILDEPKLAELKEKYIDLPITITKTKIQEPDGLNRVGKKVNGKYEVVEFLGGGLNGDVYKAKLLGTEDEYVAIKFTKDENTFNLLHKLRHLKDKSVVSIKDWNYDEGFVVFEYKPCNLRDVLDELKKTDEILPIEVAKDIIYQVIKAIGCAHENGIVHKDIKPENILLDEKGNVAVCDFGLAREVQPDDLNSLRSVKGFEGTIQYSAPEQEEDPTKATKQTDAYQIGLIFNELLFKTRRIAPEAPHEQRIDIDKETTEKVLRGLLCTNEHARQCPEEIVQSNYAWLLLKPIDLKIIHEEPEVLEKHVTLEKPERNSVDKEFWDVLKETTEKEVLRKESEPTNDSALQVPEEDLFDDLAQQTTVISRDVDEPEPACVVSEPEEEYEDEDDEEDEVMYE